MHYTSGVLKKTKSRQTLDILNQATEFHSMSISMSISVQQHKNRSYVQK